MKWFDGVWSRFKPEIGKDRRGITGVKKEDLKDIGKKITQLPKNFNIHKTLIKIFENKQKMFTQPIILLIGLLPSYLHLQHF